MMSQGIVDHDPTASKLRGGHLDGTCNYTSPWHQPLRSDLHLSSGLLRGEAEKKVDETLNFLREGLEGTKADRLLVEPLRSNYLTGRPLSRGATAASSPYHENP